MGRVLSLSLTPISLPPPVCLLFSLTHRHVSLLTILYLPIDPFVFVSLSLSPNCRSRSLAEYVATCDEEAAAAREGLSADPAAAAAARLEPEVARAELEELMAARARAADAAQAEEERVVEWVRQLDGLAGYLDQRDEL